MENKTLEEKLEASLKEAFEDLKDREREAIKRRMENKYAPQQRYDAKNTTKISLKLNKTTDADILEVLDQAESKQGMIKQLIREGMKKSRG